MSCRSSSPFCGIHCLNPRKLLQVQMGALCCTIHAHPWPGTVDLLIRRQRAICWPGHSLGWQYWENRGGRGRNYLIYACIGLDVTWSLNFNSQGEDLFDFLPGEELVYLHTALWVFSRDGADLDLRYNTEFHCVVSQTPELFTLLDSLGCFQPKIYKKFYLKLEKINIKTCPSMEPQLLFFYVWKVCCVYFYYLKSPTLEKKTEQGQGCIHLLKTAWSGAVIPKWGADTTGMETELCYAWRCTTCL